MTILSVFFYVVAHHPLKLALLTPPLILLASLAPPLKKHRVGCMALALPVFVVGMLNIFLGQYANAAFLNAVGTRGEAVVIHSRMTSSRLNEEPIWAYEAVVTTADGRTLSTRFNTMTATLWPIRNAILIPPRDEAVPVKYVPGFPRNIVFLVDESPSGRRRLAASWREPVETAARRLEVSPDNPAFARTYRSELERYLAEHGDADPAVTADYRERLRALDDETSDPAS